MSQRGSRTREAVGFTLLVAALGLPGVGILGAGVYQAYDLHRFLSAARAATGRVQSLTLLRSSDDSSTYRLVVDYPIAPDTTRRLSVETSRSGYAEGQPVEVLYTTDPPEGRVRGIRTDWTTPTIFLVVGAAWAGFGVLILVVGFRHRATTSRAETGAPSSV